MDDRHDWTLKDHLIYHGLIGATGFALGFFGSLFADAPFALALLGGALVGAGCVFLSRRDDRAFWRWFGELFD